MNQETPIPVLNWVHAGEPFRLVAVDIHAADWSRWLTPEAQARTARFSDPRAWARAGASEWFKGCWLPRELGLEQVEWKTGMHGKPRPAGAASGWGFNLSHAGDYVVAALMQGAAIGVDLESMSRPADIELLAKRVFSESEQALVSDGGREAFFILWSQKEALLKALGCGWANGGIVRRTKLVRIAYQEEPATRVKIWSRRLFGGAYTLAVGVF